MPLAFSLTDEQLAAFAALIAKNVQPAAIDLDLLADKVAARLAQPSVLTEQMWERVYRDDWSKYPLSVNFPNDTVPWSNTYDPWVAGLGADGNLLMDHASAQIVANPDSSRYLSMSIWNTLWKDIGSRVFLCDHLQWKWWGGKFADGSTGRLTVPITYINPVTLAGGVGAYCQVFAEFKTLEKDPVTGRYLPTAVQILLRQEKDGYYFYMNLGGTVFEPEVREPLKFGVPLVHELTIEFSTQKTAKVVFRCGKTVVRGTGRTLNPANAQVGGGLLVYSNEIQPLEKLTAQFGVFTVDRLVS